MKIDKASAEHYLWQEVCDGWHFVKSDDLSVIVEKMPPFTAEDMHYHEKSRQFFFIIDGEAAMILDGEEFVLQAGEGIEIKPLQRHQMRNDFKSPLEFIVISSPKAHGDRVAV